MTFEEADQWLENEHDGEFLKETGGHQDLLGFQIMAKYVKPDADIVAAAEHDIIYCIEHPENMPEEEILMLHRLGFHLDSDGECWAKFA